MTVLEKIKRCVSLVWDFQEIYGEEDIEDFCHNELCTYPQFDEIMEYFEHIENSVENNEWFDATKLIPVPKNLKITRYSTEAISSEGDLVCYDYQNKEWNKIILEDDRVSYVPVKIREWTNKPIKEQEL